MMGDDWLVIAVRLGIATLFGLILGFEREWRRQDAGLRTHALVALSSATIMVSALALAEDLHEQGGESDPLRVVQGLAQAIGFIAGGLIFVRGGGVKNMTTASSLWMAASIGIAAGAGQFELVLIGSGLALILLTLINALKRLIPRHNVEQAADDSLTNPNRRGEAEEG